MHLSIAVGGAGHTWRVGNCLVSELSKALCNAGLANVNTRGAAGVSVLHFGRVENCGVGRRKSAGRRAGQHMR